ncbi:sulfoxide reductase heme-binding subunit YedZ [Stappia sp. F7233]|uniref:Protein-methionine-sulfoxide reductase heme-binding subunit MsrQ n=1 Tax=Stappia albiluteola TaxID=2758565 RepID=A0A839AFI3_9HYPH|nr:protein-methionine-sulfoxide reductase heme-binding subunit MsrQ [Stappia albiluteola]MBA5778610.1 sulfoxide reductase heme-binding subunit YedZ [Stappia albiluteola]
MVTGTQASSISGYLPWTERNGRFSSLKFIAFAATLAPGLYLVFGLLTNTLGPKPVTIALHETGDWAIRFLFLSLLITPLRRIAAWNRLVNIRRMLGLAAAAYALLHLGLYVVDQAFDLSKIASEIVLRFYLTIGFVALVGLMALGVTSTDGAIRRMGQNWHRLHKLTYGIAILAAFHFFLQSKSDVTEATLMAGFYVALMLYRAAQKRGFNLASPVVLAVIAALAGLATAGIEYLWYALATGIPAERVLAANLDFRYSIRPAWWVFGTGMAFAGLPVLRMISGRFRQVLPRFSSART